MIVSYNWLKEFVDIELEPHEVAHKLTMCGLEVDSVERVYGYDAVVGCVVGVERRDRLFQLEIDVGNDKSFIVASSVGVGVGDKVAVVVEGGYFGDLRVEKKRLGTIESHGVLLGYTDFGFDYEEPIIFDDNAPAGMPLRDMAEFNDYIFDIEVTPNRGDALSVLGVARDLAAIVGVDVVLPEVGYDTVDRRIEDSLYVRVEDSDLCPRYCLFGAQVSVFASPFFMRFRLIKSGVRPINNVVDITNYAMLSLGQPLHGFDMDKLSGGIVVRRSRGSEKILALDEKEYLLTSDMLAITDESGPVAIAGVMGGELTKIDEGTRCVALESAHFDPISVRKTSRALKLHSESSHRFERGVDPNLCEFAGKYALSLMGRYASGKAFATHFDVKSGEFHGKVVRTSVSHINSLLGTSLDCETVTGILRRLNFAPRIEGDELVLSVPSYRFDVSMDADVAEEVARILGYDSIPSTMPSVNPSFEPVNKRFIARDTIFGLLTSQGLHECISYSFVNDKKEKLFGRCEPVKVLNPLTEDQSVMRTTLLVSLMENLALNVSRGVRSVSLFELADVFERDGEEIKESEHLGVLLYGTRPLSIYSKGEVYDFYDIKGIMESVLEALRVVPSFKPSRLKFLHPGRSAVILLDGNEAGFIGEIHPDIYQHYPVEFGRFRILVGELYMDDLLRNMSVSPKYEKLPRFPTVIRDISIVVEKGADTEEIRRFILSFDRVYRVVLFDCYDRLSEEGKKSLTYRLVLRDDRKTFRDDEIDEVISEVIEGLNKMFGAKLRG